MLSYDLNRLLFHRMNALAVRPAFRRTMGTWGRCSRWHLSPELLEAYHTECLDRTVSILSEGERSPLLREDPNGTSALMQVRARRRDVKRMVRRGLPVQHHLREASRGWAPDPHRDGSKADPPGAAISEDPAPVAENLGPVAALV
jgi:hypothetical protein